MEQPTEEVLSRWGTVEKRDHVSTCNNKMCLTFRSKNTWKLPTSVKPSYDSPPPELSKFFFNLSLHRIFGQKKHPFILVNLAQRCNTVLCSAVPIQKSYKNNYEPYPPSKLKLHTTKRCSYGDLDACNAD